MLSARIGVGLAGLALLAAAAAAAERPINIGSRLELMVDEYLIERLSGGAALRLHHPVPREVVLVCDAPWEGSGCGYFAVFQDGEAYRMYYRGSQIAVKGRRLVRGHPFLACLAESADGVRWTKPSLGLFEFAGSKKNNIVWEGVHAHDFTPFKDTHPACPPEARYKALAMGNNPRGAYAFQSPDGIHWTAMNDGKPVITKGAFDTQNLAFWDSVRGEYRAYIRDFKRGKRDIRTATSEDFIQWTEPVWLRYPGMPQEHLYTNQIKPYPRAPHLYIGFPTRYIDRGWSPSMHALPDPEHRKQRATANRRYGTALTEGLLMTSRDGLTFKRWREAFLRPGLRLKDGWNYGDNYIAWHVVETRSAVADAPNELSLYATESYWTGTATRLRRYTLRLDGFVSISAPMAGGEILTKPLIFQGKELVVNFSTSAAGSIRVELQEAAGKAIKGRALADCPDVFGDSLERVVTWRAGSDLSALAGRPVRLRITLADADLYALRFRP